MTQLIQELEQDYRAYEQALKNVETTINQKEGEIERIKGQLENLKNQEAQLRGTLNFIAVKLQRSQTPTTTPQVVDEEHASTD